MFGSIGKMSYWNCVLVGRFMKPWLNCYCIVQGCFMKHWVYIGIIVFLRLFYETLGVAIGIIVWLAFDAYVMFCIANKLVQ